MSELDIYPNSRLATSPVVPSLIGGLLNALTLPLFIFAAGPVSGGHLNPTVAIAAFFARLSTIPRSILYVGLQILGATIAGYFLRASFDTRSVSITLFPVNAESGDLADSMMLQFAVPGCVIDTSIVSEGSAFAIVCDRFHAHIPLIQRGFGPTTTIGIWPSSWTDTCWPDSRDHELRDGI